MRTLEVETPDCIIAMFSDLIWGGRRWYFGWLPKENTSRRRRRKDHLLCFFCFFLFSLLWRTCYLWFVATNTRIDGALRQFYRGKMCSYDYEVKMQSLWAPPEPHLSSIQHPSYYFHPMMIWQFGPILHSLVPIQPRNALYWIQSHQRI